MPSTRERPSVAAVATALGLLYVIWGSTYLAIRFALEGGFPPFWLGAIRFLVAGGAMYAWLRLRGTPAPTRAQWPTLAVMGLLLLGFGNGMVNLAEQSVSSGLAAVAVASAPLWIGLFAMLRGDHPTRMEWAGLAIGFAGVAWLNAGSTLTASPTGLVALLVAPLAWGFGSIWSRGRDLPAPFMASAGQMLCGAVVMAVMALLTGERFEAMPTPKGIAAFWYLVVAGSLLGFTAYIWLLHNVRPALAGSYAYVNPAIAVLLGAALAGERFSAHDVGAMAVILAAVVLISLAKAGRKAG